mgnify:CR=1 FL=1
MKYKILFILAIQNVVYNIVVYQGHISFNIVSVLFLSDLIRMFISSFIYILYYQHEVIKIKSWDKIVVPAFVGVIEHNTLFYGMTYLPPTTFQIIYQFHILFGAILSPYTLTRKQQISIVLLTFGLIEILSDNDVTFQSHEFKGIIFTLIGTAADAIAATKVERLVKETASSIWMRHMQLSTLGVMSNLIAILVNQSDFFYGFNLYVVCIIFMQCLGSIIIPFVLKYADNVTRGVANSLSMLIAIVISKVIYLWKPPYHFYIGSALIFIALFLYHKPPIKKSAILTV